MSRVFAYCRVSTVDQTTDNQVREIASAGFAVDPRRVIAETISGSQAARERPGFSTLLIRLEPGDVLVVTKLDRLGRSALDVRNTVDTLTMIGVRVHCLALGGMDLTSAAGKMTMQVLAAIAEFELDLLKERTHAGLQRAKAEGKHIGRPAKTSEADREAIKQALAQGSSVSQVARDYGISRATVLRVKDLGEAEAVA